ncbi:MAG: hypothetical protein LE168_01455 [Endomicrobium sp.]|nr:hypothetical protein [Endomicrobium sp.]
MKKHIAVLLSLSIILSSCSKGNDVARVEPVADEDIKTESVEKELEPKATDYSLSESPAVPSDSYKFPSGSVIEDCYHHPFYCGAIVLGIAAICVLLYWHAGRAIDRNEKRSKNLAKLNELYPLPEKIEEYGDDDEYGLVNTSLAGLEEILGGRASIACSKGKYECDEHKIIASKDYKDYAIPQGERVNYWTEYSEILGEFIEEKFHPPIDEGLQGKVDTNNPLLYTQNANLGKRIDKLEEQTQDIENWFENMRKRVSLPTLP